MSKLAATPADRDIAALLEPHRVELTGYCYRMLGSAFEAEDAVQESFVRAWRGFESFEARASLRSWLYRITTNVCLSMIGARQRRARPLDLCAPWDRGSTHVSMLEENSWIEPIPDALVLPASQDPAAQLAARESIRLAFLAALQLLPARQRAVLLLRDVLHWQAREVAELLETSEISVQSALQRARATLAEEQTRMGAPARSSQLQDQALLERYVEAFSRWDLDQLISLLHEDATQVMPPHALWLKGAAAIHQWWLGPGSGCAGSRVLQVGAANGLPAVAQYRPLPDGGHEAFAIHVLEIADGLIVAHNSFLDPRLFPLFGLPLQPAR